MKQLLSFILVLTLLFSGCAHNQSGVKKSSSLESEFGSAINQQILQRIPVYAEPTLNEYVQSIGYKIVKYADRQELEYRFIILNDDRIFSAYAPGGYVYITTGFFRLLENEIELAGVIAYEIAAVQYQDPRLSRLKKSLELMIRGGSYVAPAFGAIGALSVLGLAAIGAVTSNGKSLMAQVDQADRKALNYLAVSGYDPQGFIGVLYKMVDVKSVHRAYLYDYLQSHPVDSIRLKNINLEFQKLPLENREFNAGRENFLAKTELIRNSFVRK